MCAMWNFAETPVVNKIGQCSLQPRKRCVFLKGTQAVAHCLLVQSNVREETDNTFIFYESFFGDLGLADL